MQLPSLAFSWRKHGRTEEKGGIELLMPTLATIYVMVPVSRACFCQAETGLSSCRLDNFAPLLSGLRFTP